MEDAALLEKRSSFGRRILIQSIGETIILQLVCKFYTAIEDGIQDILICVDETVSKNLEVFCINLRIQLLSLGGHIV